jgi:hypothetical protein
LDQAGDVRDWDWLQTTFGPVAIHHAPDSPAYRVCVLRAQEWDATVTTQAMSA